MLQRRDQQSAAERGPRRARERRDRRAGDGRELTPRRVDVDVAGEPREQLEMMAPFAAVRRQAGVVSQRPPHPCLGIPHVFECGGHDAGDRHHRPVEPDGVSHDLRVRAEPSPPQPVRYDADGWCPWRVVRLAEVASKNRGNTEDTEVGRADTRPWSRSASPWPVRVGCHDRETVTRAIVRLRSTSSRYVPNVTSNGVPVVPLRSATTTSRSAAGYGTLSSSTGRSVLKIAVLA